MTEEETRSSAKWKNRLRQALALFNAGAPSREIRWRTLGSVSGRRLTNTRAGRDRSKSKSAAISRGPMPGRARGEVLLRPCGRIFILLTLTRSRILVTNFQQRSSGANPGSQLDYRHPFSSPGGTVPPCRHAVLGCTTYRPASGVRSAVRNFAYERTSAPSLQCEATSAKAIC